MARSQTLKLHGVHRSGLSADFTVSEALWRQRFSEDRNTRAHAQAMICRRFYNALKATNPNKYELPRKISWEEMVVHEL